jgi:aminopeptidase
MSISAPQKTKAEQKFPPLELSQLLITVFHPKPGEKLCILIDLDKVEDVIKFAFLKNNKLEVQHKAYETFYQEIHQNLMKKFQLKACDFFAYKRTGGSNLELPATAMTPEGKTVNFEKDIYPHYDIILCISTDSATAPLTASAKRHGFRGATMHGLNDIILASGLAVDYKEVSKFTEKLRKGLTQATDVEIDFVVFGKPYHLRLELGKQEAQKSHGICHKAPDIANLPAGEVYFVPIGGKGEFPIKFDNGTIGLLHITQGRATKISLIKGDQAVIDAYQLKLDVDPFTGVIGELGFGTQKLPYSGRDIQDEKIFGTFHLATGRNDHLNGLITKELFVNPLNATHDDILFSSTKTPEIEVKQVRMHRQGETHILIENYKPSKYLLDLL